MFNPFRFTLTYIAFWSQVGHAATTKKEFKNQFCLSAICLSTQHKKACEATLQKHNVLLLSHCGCTASLCLKEKKK